MKIKELIHIKFSNASLEQNVVCGFFPFIFFIFISTNWVFSPLSKVSCFFFLRLLCPAIVSPSNHKVPLKYTKFDSVDACSLDITRSLISISKSLYFVLIPPSSASSRPPSPSPSPSLPYPYISPSPLFPFPFLSSPSPLPISFYFINLICENSTTSDWKWMFGYK